MSNSTPQTPVTTPSFRIGNGYDIHRLVPGRPLILGGQQLEHPAGLGLDGHSDADVLVHAIMDALLGALSLGDIGNTFLLTTLNGKVPIASCSWSKLSLW